MAHVELDDAEIIELVQEEQIEELEVEVVAPVMILTKNEKLNGIATVLQILDLTLQEDRHIHRRLREIQHSIRTSPNVQKTLDTWFQ